jgi:outer membrane protein insertion porin family
VGGNTKFLKPVLEGAWYIPHLSRTTIGIRTQYQFIASASPQTIPVFERLWLGGEFSVRGFDIRRIGPTVADLNPEVPQDSFQGRTVMGGNKSLLLNLEYQIRIAQPVRFIFFYDTGQVQDFGDRFAMNDFKTSTGVELRIFMPMLNVPFRLIYSWNPQRDGVYNDNFQQQEETTFRFAVGTTF